MAAFLKIKKYSSVEKVSALTKSKFQNYAWRSYPPPSPPPHPPIPATPPALPTPPYRCFARGQRHFEDQDRKFRKTKFFVFIFKNDSLTAFLKIKKYSSVEKVSALTKSKFQNFSSCANQHYYILFLCCVAEPDWKFILFKVNVNLLNFNIMLGRGGGGTYL